jgi:hypothetical protein
VAISWSHYSDEDIASVSAATDDYLVEHRQFSEDIEATQRVFQSLVALPPMTSNNLFSGNLAPLFEAGRELTASITLARLGLYKQALTTLRSALELGLLSVYWDADDQSHVDIQNWWRGSDPTPHARAVEESLSQIAGVAAYMESDSDFLVRVKALGWALGGYVHTRGGRNSHSWLVPSTNVLAFSEEALSLWRTYLIDVGRAVLAVHLMKYPVGLQITPLSRKFGLNPPAGGFVEPHVRDRFREYLAADVQEALQSLSDQNEDALDRAAWVNGQPDITDLLLQEQVERHDREWIEMGGFESWFKSRQVVDAHIWSSLSDKERADRSAYYETLREWSTAEGFLTLESSRLTRMKRSRERE